jgi:zinc transport system ATP-binding protein
MPLIDCRDLSFAYEGSVVLHRLNFSVDRGDYLCIVGENGSGKSTLIRGLLRMKPPRSGTLLFDPALRPEESGYLPQQGVAQKDFPAGAYEVVLSGRLGLRGLRPFYSKADKAAARAVMERLAIHDLARRCYRELSGGQQRRVLLARALCAADRMKILFLDEPASGLDPLVTAGLYEELARVNAEMGVAVVMVSHDIQSALKYASRVLHLQNAQLFFGTGEEYAASEFGKRFLEGGAPDKADAVQKNFN